MCCGNCGAKLDSEIIRKAKLFATGYLGDTIYEPVLTPEDISRGYKPIVEFTFKQ